MKLDKLLSRHARYRPQHTAVVIGDLSLTYAQFNTLVNQYANALLDLGLRKGDKIATILPNCIEQLTLYWAVAKTGLVIVPMSPMLRGSGLARLINDSDSVFVLCDRAFAPYLDPVRRELAQVADDRFFVTDATELNNYRYFGSLVADASTAEPPDAHIESTDPYNIFYSSGTTGLPKGIVHTHDVRAGYCTIFSSAYRMTPESVILHGGSIVFNGAFLSLPQAFFLGATYILMQGFNAERFIELVEQHQVTHVIMVPSQIIAVLNSPVYRPERLYSLQCMNTVGAPLHREIKEQIKRELPGRFYELYGLTEGFMTILDPDQFERKTDSVGVPIRFYEMKIVDPAGNQLPAGQIGEIIGRGPLMTPGYYKRPDLTAQAIKDGWLWSGDLGYTDEDGFLYLVDRSKDMIVSGGVNVYPRDIEEIVIQHPAVREVAVFGIPDQKWGETPIAAVILKGDRHVAADELKAWVNARVEARFQKLNAVVIHEQFPRSTAGKTLKRIMRESYWSDRDTTI